MSTRQNSFDFAQESYTPDWRKTPKFDGKTFDEKLDGPRLNKQAQLVFDLMRDGQWRSLAEISRQTSQPEASISARLRDLRKPRFGNWDVQRKRIDGGLFQYRVVAK